MIFKEENSCMHRNLYFESLAFSTSLLTITQPKLDWDFTLVFGFLITSGLLQGLQPKYILK